MDTSMILNPEYFRIFQNLSTTMKTRNGPHSSTKFRLTWTTWSDVDFRWRVRIVWVAIFVYQSVYIYYIYYMHVVYTLHIYQHHPSKNSKGTLPKTTVTYEKRNPIEKEIPFSKPSISGSRWIFPAVRSKHFGKQIQVEFMKYYYPPQN